jgi:hypothetical protein
MATDDDLRNGLGSFLQPEKGGFHCLDSGQAGFQKVDSLDSAKESGTPRA